MLEEKLLLLDKKVTSLLDELRRAREDNATLRADAERLKAQADEDAKSLAADAAKLRHENDALRNKIALLDKDGAERTAREQEFRERLRAIIEKIDALEKTGDE